MRAARLMMCSRPLWERMGSLMIDSISSAGVTGFDGRSFVDAAARSVGCTALLCQRSRCCDDGMI